MTGDILQTVHPDRRMLTIKQPVGVVAAITPWCDPLVSVFWAQPAWHCQLPHAGFCLSGATGRRGGFSL